MRLHTLALLLVALFGSGIAHAQDPLPAAPVSTGGDSPVVRAVPGNLAMTFAFGGLGSLRYGGALDQKAGDLLFTEFGMRAVLSSVIIPFSVGLGIGNSTTRTDPAVSTTDFGLSFSGGILKPFRAWRRIVPYAGGQMHFHYLDPSGDKNWQVQLSLGPVLGVEYYIADRVSLLLQGTFQFGVTMTDPVAMVGLASSISGGGQMGLSFYF
ncbi:MAG TPA: hypothetical protein PLA87_10105 [Pseudomonadota bacterium]|nr:hypothetical protein [Pseudomonadota bacterium]